MLDNLDPNEPRTPKTRETPIEQRPLADREVPLTGRPGAAILHAWLDGEMPESAARHSDVSRDVDFWLRLDRDLVVRRQMTTPAHVYDQIMAALPAVVPVTATKWYSRRFTTTVSTAAIAATGVFFLGLMIGIAIYLAR